MTTLLLVRHGQSTYNDEDRFAGQCHIPLSELGRLQAEKAADYIAKHFSVDCIYSSDLLRAYGTACAISEKLGMMEIHIDKGLREICAGEWEGLGFFEIPEKYPEEHKIWMDDIGASACPGGETVAEMFCRVKDCLARIAVENDGKTVAIAFHSTPIRALRAYCADGNLGNMKNINWAPNASVSVVKFADGAFWFAETEITEHLSGIESKKMKI